jgi:dipeptidyl aminopeptidase/acylaminoacyl peptidase
MLRLRWLRTAVSLILGSTSLTLLSEELPVASFFRNSEHAQAGLSPSGQHLAALSPHGPRVGLAVVDLNTRTPQWAFASDELDVEWFQWVNDERLVFHVWDEEDEFGALLAADRDGKHQRSLKFERYWSRYLSKAPGSDKDIYVECTSRAADDAFFPHVARVDTYTGHFTIEVANPGYVLGWLVDHDGVPRVGVGVDRDRFRVIHRSKLGKPWETIASYGPAEDGPEPVGFTADNRSLYVLDGGGQATLGLYRFDLEQRKPVELLFRHQDGDVAGLIFHPRTHALVGVAYETDRPRRFWADPEYRRFQANVDLVFTNGLNYRASASRDGSKVLLLSTSDRNPGTYYLVDWASKKWEQLFEVAPWIPVEQMAEMKPLTYRSRDGLLIHGYLTLPANGPRTNLPLVMDVHGGPWVRDSWGYNPEVQFLANRGYAVLQVNFRGSAGYGIAFLRAGDREWGRKMQDDLTDGVKWAIAEGVADPKRVAIFGASYGGYAAMAGLAFTPELYRCGVNLSGVTDIDTFLKRPERTTRASRARAFYTIGDPKRERERLEEVSPLNFVDRIQAPVFLAYGGKDERVPLEQGKRLASELKKQGKTYELMIKKDEGHGYRKEENKIELYQRIDAFLKQHLK